MNNLEVYVFILFKFLIIINKKKVQKTEDCFTLPFKIKRFIL